MAKALRTAAFVVGAVALAATGIGAAVGAGAFLGIAGSTIATIGTVASLASGAASIAVAATTSTPQTTGNPAKFTINKDAGQPYIMGICYSGGMVVHRAYYGVKNDYESWVAVHSLGPVRSLGPLQIDKQDVPFSGGNAGGAYAGFMWLDQQLGACPEGRALTGPTGPFPGWGPASKLSGLAADLWTLKFDSKGKVYPNGVPQRGRIVEGVFVYDPRQDGTYPGGAGACRLGDEATYVWSDNPALHAVTWAFGRHQNGVLMAGGGLEAVGIDLASAVDWANTCEVNGWTVNGVVYTESDDAWDVLKMICQAGGGEPVVTGGILGFTVSAPRVSIGRITSADVTGDVDAPSTASRRLRRNTVIPRIVSESHGWETVPLDAIEIPDYVAVDGGRRPREISFPLVTGVDQGAQLGLYALLDARELDPISLPCKVYALGYRPGDCLTVDIPEASLIERDVIVRSREIDAASMSVALSCRSETQGKHAFALGKTGTAPPTPDLSVPPSYPIDVTRGARQIIGGSVTGIFESTATGISLPAQAAILDDSSPLSLPEAEIDGLEEGTTYVVSWSLAEGAYHADARPALAVYQDPDRVIVRLVTTQLADGTYPAQPTPGGGDGGGGYGGGGIRQDVDLQ